MPKPKKYSKPKIVRFSEKALVANCQASCCSAYTTAYCDMTCTYCGAVFGGGIA